ncbi:hypothetical protein [Streptomyces sp. 8L]|uniref:hypothetical protein n=1 Tax=Streptomyces sp. 8L TaxID=2877242 RepID=UPI001CD1EE41|nr:hypothetical protein [Streptomyces sp. 8L]MCA1218706.1 hypothetical protein [Streptomyces sp. 8L]
MTITAFPINADSGAPSYSSQAFRQALAALISPGATGLAVQPGSRPGAGLDTSVSGTTVSVSPGVAVVQGGSSNTQGPYVLSCDAVVTKTLAAANATNARVDLVYARIRDTDADATGARDGDVILLTGTPAASPIAPTPTDATFVILATISVPKSGGGNPVVSTATRPYTAAAGGLTVGQVAPPAPYLGQLWDSGDGTRRWDGTRWRYLVLEPKVTQQISEPPYAAAADFVLFTSAAWPPLTFTVPPSGSVWVSVSGSLQNTASLTSTAWMSWAATGGYTEAAGNQNALACAGSRVYATRRVLRTGLTPGVRVTLTPAWAASAIGTPLTDTRIDSGQLMVEPIA